MSRAALVLAALLAATPALAQSGPPWSYGQVPTPGQWIQAFQQKQDVLNYVPCNPAGCTFTGLLNVTASTTSGANLNLGVGSAPTSPNNADLWETSFGLFGRVSGVTVWFPSISSGTPSIASNACGSSTQGTITAGSLDEALTVTVGTASVTSCTVTYSVTLANAPHSCWLTPRNAAAAAWGTTGAYISTHSTTSLVITGSALDGAEYDVGCI